MLPRSGSALALVAVAVACSMENPAFRADQVDGGAGSGDDWYPDDDGDAEGSVSASQGSSAGSSGPGPTSAGSETGATTDPSGTASSTGTSSTQGMTSEATSDLSASSGSDDGLSSGNDGPSSSSGSDDDDDDGEPPMSDPCWIYGNSESKCTAQSPSCMAIKGDLLNQNGCPVLTNTFLGCASTGGCLPTPSQAWCGQGQLHRHGWTCAAADGYAPCMVGPC